MKNTLFGKKLLAVRKNLKLSLEEVENETGIPTSTLSDYENERIENPNLTKLNQLCNYYGVSLPAILAQKKEQHILARANAVVSSQEIDKLEETIRCVKDFTTKYHQLKVLLFQGGLSDVRQAKMYPNDESLDWRLLGNEISRDERQIMKCEQGEPIDLISHIRKNNHILLFSAELPDNIDGLFFGSDDNLLFFIVINSLVSSVRQNFTLAHEYAHFLVDREKQSYICTDIFRSTNAIEKRANYIASRLLVPSSGIIKYYEENKSKLTAKDVVSLCLKFQVSYESMVYRLDDEKIINESKKVELFNYPHTSDFEYRGLLNSLKASFDNNLHININCFFNKENMSEVELEYINMVRTAYDKGLISYSKIEEYIPDKTLIKELQITPSEIDLDALF